MEAAQLVEELLNYGVGRLHLDALDVSFVRNLLLSKFKLDVTDMPKSETDPQYSPDELYNKTAEFGEQTGDLGDLFAAEIFGLLTPSPSAIERRFCELERLYGFAAACDDFYALCIANNYIRMSSVARNKKWFSDDPIPLEITINLSKPEKNNREIAAAAKAVKSDISYPQCMLCVENEGFRGTALKPPRTNLRKITVNLGNRAFFMQYSPYLYFNEHCIVISNQHVPMKVDAETPGLLLDFVDRFPTYFLGSNAALPIVGGSILGHEHFQGGHHTMPMQKAEVSQWYQSSKTRGVFVGVVDWYNSVVRIKGHDKEKVASVTANLIEMWNRFDAPEVGVLSHTGDVRHNAVAPVARKVGADFIVDCILRNNRTDESYPDGIFHAHPEYHHIKSEGIGLIEVMGLFILPARLNAELSQVADVVANPENLTTINSETHPLFQHRHMIEQLIGEVGGKDSDTVANAVKQYVDRTCRNILDNTAVFDKSTAGRKAMTTFLRACKVKVIL